MNPKKESPPRPMGGPPKRDQHGGSVVSDDNPHRALSQQEAWRLACIVFGSELPAPRRDICGTSSDGIRYWRAASR